MVLTVPIGWIEPAVNVTPGAPVAWGDVDVSGSVPAGATGVILHVRSTGTGSLSFGYRKNGGADARTDTIPAYRHGWCAVGVDASRIFEIYMSSTEIQIWLVGYLAADAVFLTNGVNKSLGLTGAWTDIDCSAQAPGAIGLVFETRETSGVLTAFGLRMNGSADARTNNTAYRNCVGVIIGCDAGQVVEGYIGGTSVDWFLLGYVTAEAIFNVNAVNVSLGSINSWIDRAALPAGATGGFYEVANNAGAAAYGLRKNGSAESILTNAVNHPWGMVACDASQLVEGRIASTDIDFFVVGHSFVAAAGVAMRRTLSPIGTRTGSRQAQAS